ncbi:MAG: hypothetical protein IT285_06195 [Bdellovibrionales bacterium]|nr:hypothetical protein [Bdellovibrionales bacterium]
MSFLGSKALAARISLLGLMGFTLLLVAGAPVAQANPRALEGILARLVLAEVEAAGPLIRRVTGISSEAVSRPMVNSFLERMRWEQSRALRGHLDREFGDLNREFEAFRTRRGSTEPIRDGHVLTAEEREFLEEAARRRLATNRIENLLDEAVVFLRTPKPFASTTAHGTSSPVTLATTQQEFLAGAEAANTSHSADDIVAIGTGEEIPRLPLPAAAGASLGDVASARISWWAQIGVRLRAYRDFSRAFMIAEGNWRSLFGAGGKRFSVDDLVMIRRLNRLLNSLNDYAKTRLMMRAFANERPALYSRLNEATAEATEEFRQGLKEIDEYLKLRGDEAAKLGMNDIVQAAERRMLNAVRKCKELGGRAHSADEVSGIIEMGERNFQQYSAQLRRVLNQVNAARARIPELKRARRAAPAGSDARRLAQTRLDETRRALHRAQAEYTLWRQRLNETARELRSHYLEYIESYEALDTFINLRSGRINSERVSAFNLPDPFVPGSADLARWAPVYERALYNSTNDLVVGEARLFFRTRVGHTRKFVQDMNKLTERYIGRRFTETRFGKEFYQFNRGLASVTLRRIGGFLGVTIPSGVAYNYADGIWKFMFGDDEPTPEDPNRPVGSSAADSNDAESVAPPVEVTPDPAPLDPQPIDDELPPNPAIEEPRPQDFSDDPPPAAPTVPVPAPAPTSVTGPNPFL